MWFSLSIFLEYTFALINMFTHIYLPKYIWLSYYKGRTRVNSFVPTYPYVLTSVHYTYSTLSCIPIKHDVILVHYKCTRLKLPLHETSTLPKYLLMVYLSKFQHLKNAFFRKRCQDFFLFFNVALVHGTNKTK